MPRGVYQRSEAQREWARKFFKGNPYVKGRKLSKENIEAMNKNRKGRVPWNKGMTGYKAGEQHYRWKGGQTREERTFQSNKRNRVLKRLRSESLSHTFGEWELLKTQYGHTCPCCKKAEPEIKLTIDHIIPLSKGGSDLIENIQPLCLKCNLRKHTKSTKY